ncbi:MAG: hypothetical protein ACI9LM_002326 [Alteromonadaceae bacterium]|jgi:hypothetical protein
MLISEIGLNVELFLKEFVEEQKGILEIDISEQTISSEIKAKLERIVSGWNIDCEYNRNTSQIKCSNMQLHLKVIYQFFIEPRRLRNECYLFFSIMTLPKRGIINGTDKT